MHFLWYLPCLNKSFFQFCFRFTHHHCHTRSFHTKINMGPKKKPEPEVEEEEEEINPQDVFSLEDYQERTTPFFEELYKECDFRVARSCSREERHNNEYSDPSLAYGEILWQPFAEAFLKLKYLYGFREVGGKFVDIGSGTAKPV